MLYYSSNLCNNLCNNISNNNKYNLYPYFQMNNNNNNKNQTYYNKTSHICNKSKKLNHLSNFKNPTIHSNYNNNNKKEYKKTIECLNCGILGHTIKTCNYPITSYGVVCYYINNKKEIKYLLIQRKDSLCYIEFIRGKYDLTNLDFLCNIFKCITNKEKELIKHSDFDTLWNTLWKNFNNIKFKKEYDNSKNKFNKLKEGYYFNNKFINLDYIYNLTTNNNEESVYNHNEWEFPKGRRNINEKNLYCAKREFEEETGIHKKNLQIMSKKTFEEIYIAINKTRYRHIYYIGKYLINYNYNNNTVSNNMFDPNNEEVIKEVRDIQWFTYEEVLDKLRNIYIERIEMFKRIHKEIKKIECL